MKGERQNVMRKSWQISDSYTWIASDRWVCKRKHLGISWYLSDNNTNTQASEKGDKLKHTWKIFESQ